MFEFHEVWGWPQTRGALQRRVLMQDPVLLVEDEGALIAICWAVHWRALATRS